MARPAKNPKVEKECRVCHQVKSHTTVMTVGRLTVPGPCVDCEGAKRKARREDRQATEPDYYDKVRKANTAWQRSEKGLAAKDARKGTSEQQAAQRRYDESLKGRARLQRARGRAAESGRDKARAAVRYALEQDVLTRPTGCRICKQRPGLSSDGRSLIEAHHHLGYAPEHHLDVWWVCRACHAKLEDRSHPSDEPTQTLQEAPGSTDTPQPIKSQDSLQSAS